MFQPSCINHIYPPEPDLVALNMEISCQLATPGKPLRWNNKEKDKNLSDLGHGSSVGTFLQSLLGPTTPHGHHHHHHHHVPEGLGMLAYSLILKMKLVPPSLPRSSYVGDKGAGA